GKCCLAVMREALTAAAAPYERNLIKGLGYSWAKMPAMAQAPAACSDGNDLPPCQNSPEPESWKGRSRPVAYFRASTAISASMADSPLRNPVSRWCSLWVKSPRKYIPAPAPAME